MDMKNYQRHLSPRHSLALFQPTLFRMNPEEFTAHTGVSLDEMRLWNEKGWLSFDPFQIDEFDERERQEVLFIRALARSGLSYAMVNNLLFGLKKPFCYDPEETFYSFAKDSWVTLPKEQPGAEMSREGIRALPVNAVWDELENDLQHHGAH
ncbi:MAG: hypothetical protein LLG97_15095 [Deltaproteobacteria bacterium]|nr:hypothetical protein [Deltaproteobacteria bacterium]